MALTGRDLREILRSANVPMYRFSKWCDRSPAACWFWCKRRKLWPATELHILTSLITRLNALEDEKRRAGGKFPPRKPMYLTDPESPPFLNRDEPAIPPSVAPTQPYERHPDAYPGSPHNERHGVEGEPERERRAPGLRHRWGEAPISLPAGSRNEPWFRSRR